MDIRPAARLLRLDLPERGEIVPRRARAVVGGHPRAIAERELQVVRQRMRWEEDALGVVQVQEASGPGNIVTLTMRAEHVTEVCTGFGERGVRAEAVAVQAVRRYLAAAVLVGEHLADQLLLPMALAGGRSFRMLPLSATPGRTSR